LIGRPAASTGSTRCQPLGGGSDGGAACSTRCLSIYDETGGGALCRRAGRIVSGPPSRGGRASASARSYWSLPLLGRRRHGDLAGNECVIGTCDRRPIAARGTGMSVSTTFDRYAASHTAVICRLKTRSPAGGSPRRPTASMDRARVGISASIDGDVIALSSSPRKRGPSLGSRFRGNDDRVAARASDDSIIPSRVLGYTRRRKYSRS
jgi:hypothetical protein